MPVIQKMIVKRELPEDLWAPLYERINYPLIFVDPLEDKMKEQIYERACRRWPGDSCVQDIVFFHRGLFDLFMKDEFALPIKKKRKK